MRKEFDLADINSIRPIVRDLLRYKKSGDALDLGCGIGRHSLFLAKMGFRVTGVDNQEEALAALKEFAKLQKLPIRVCLAGAAAYVPKKKFDVIILTMLLHFMDGRAQAAVLSRARERTKSDGINVISAYTDKNKKGMRPHLVRAEVLKRSYENEGWKLLVYKEFLVNSGQDNNPFWKVEMMAQKP